MVDEQQRLTGIFTGRDAVRLLAQGESAERTLLSKAMTHNPVTIAPDVHALDALRKMNDLGFRHLSGGGEGENRNRYAELFYR